MTLPRIDWSDFLQAAPYFNAVLIDAVDPAQAPSLAPLPRAAWYWDIFNGEVSNGGITQYLFNQASSLPAFERVPEFVAEHPRLEDALPFVRAAHEAWAELAPEFQRARQRDEWPEELFLRHAPRFEELQREFFRINHAVACRVHGDIARSPRDYLEIEPIADLPAKGVKHVLLQDGLHRLRFKDGFPVGPNLLESDDGRCEVVWFSDDRGMVQCERDGYGQQMRQWLHFDSLSSGAMNFEGGRLRSQTDQLALWERHGLEHRLSHDGRLEHLSLHLRGEALLDEYFHPHGGLKLRMESLGEGRRRTRYWPSGALNTESIEDEASRITRYLSCLDEAGVDLAPDGNGRLFEVVDENSRRRVWLEGRLVDGLLDGDLLRMERDFRKGIEREVSRTRYVRGEEMPGGG